MNGQYSHIKDTQHPQYGLRRGLIREASITFAHPAIVCEMSNQTVVKKAFSPVTPLSMPYHTALILWDTAKHSDDQA